MSLRHVLLAAALTVVSAAASAADSWVLFNPTGRQYQQELVRLRCDLPDGIKPGAFIVQEDGKGVRGQLERIDGKPYVWVAADLEPGQTHTYRVQSGRPTAAKPLVQVRQNDDFIEMDNGLMAVRVPARADGEAVPLPVLGVRLPSGKWTSQAGQWQSERKLKDFSAEPIGDGTVFGKVRLTYRFEGMAGLNGDVPANAVVDVTLPPQRRHAIIQEQHETPRHTYWELDIASGWKPNRAVVEPFHGGFGRPSFTAPDGTPYAWPPNQLVTGQTRMGDTLLNLWPRWSQAYDDGWFFLAHDGREGVGAMVCRAGKWLWPHNNGIEIKVRETGDYAGLRCPVWKGSRYWYLVAGPVDTWQGGAKEGYVIRHSLEGLDKLHHEYILSWPGLETPEDYKGDAPFWRGDGRMSRRSRAWAGWKKGSLKGGHHPITRLTRAQGWFDPDTYGNYWLFWSSENPNFATAWLRQGFWDMGHLREHPRFDELSRFAEMKFREDLYHSVTLPGGAGQECPGYLSHSMKLWQKMVPHCREYLDFDPSTWPRYTAAARFLVRISHPMGDGSRRCHPGGDTHPPGPDVFEKAAERGVEEDVSTFKTEELPGFGVIFRNRAGEPDETYLAMKAGPNRGHFHGDQLSFHYCPEGWPQAVDHHCSYGPRAGGEHMHNRVAFHTDELPYANMDGYERLIAFKTSPQVDVAMGQVESERLRITEPFPPEKWDWSLPQHTFDVPLAYRRTMVMLRTGQQDIFVIRDQHAGQDVKATYCLHAYGETCDQQGSRFDFDGLSCFVASPRNYTVGRHDWVHHNGGREATKGLRLTVEGEKSEFVTVLIPRARKRCTVAKLVLDDPFQRRGESYDMDVMLTWDDGELRRGDPLCDTSYHRKVRVSGEVTKVEQRGNRLVLEMDFEVRRKRKNDSAQCRMELQRDGAKWTGTWTGTFQGKQRSGKVTGTHAENALSPAPLYAERVLPELAPIDGGVRVGDYEVRFAGGVDDEAGTRYVSVSQNGQTLLTLTGEDVDMNRSQGEIGLFVPDAGYPFGVIPDWLIRQRGTPPEWYEDMWPLKGRDSRD